jgi:hypothetical protein
MMAVTASSCPAALWSMACRIFSFFKPFIKCRIKKEEEDWVLVAYTCNPTCLGV